jgi:hypothetical protein
MAGHAPTPLHPVDPEALADAEDERIAAFDNAEDVEPTRPATAARKQAFRLVEATPPVATIVGGAAAVLAGGAIGYWLGARRSAQPAKKAKHAAANVEHAMELLPVAMRLLANPMVRTLAVRMVMRRLAL